MPANPIAFNTSPQITLTAGEAIGEGIAVGINTSGQAVIASSTVPSIGVNLVAVASGSPASIFLHGGNGITYGVASGAITRGADVYQDASGKLSAAPTGRSELVGICLTAAGADNDVFTYIASNREMARFQTVVASGTTASIDTGFGANPAFYQWAVYTAAGALVTGASCTFTAGVANFTSVSSTNIIMLTSRLRLR